MTEGLTIETRGETIFAASLPGLSDSAVVVN